MFEEAATLPVAGLTALYVLEKGHGLLGRNVLVTGANGGVGLFACQLGKLMGANVVGLIRREEYRDLVTQARRGSGGRGEDGGAACEFGPYRLIAESVGGQVLANCLSLIDRDGICVSFGNSSQAETRVQCVDARPQRRHRALRLHALHRTGRGAGLDGLCAAGQAGLRGQAQGPDHRRGAVREGGRARQGPYGPQDPR